jgi:hypothetical protein
MSIGGYLLAALGALSLLLVGRIETSRVASFARLLDVVMRNRSARVGLVLFWWWVGWHFLVTRPVP